MPRALIRLVLPAALTVLLGAAAVHADAVAWSFNANNSTHTVPGDPGNLGAVSFATLSGSFSGNQTVPIANVFASTSPVPGQDADTFSGQSYKAEVDLTDTTSGALGVFNFTGHIFGSMSASSVSLSGTFDNSLTVHDTLGGHDYAVTIGPFISPSSPTTDGELEMSVSIDGSLGSPPPPSNKSPEPSAAILAAGGAFLAGALWLRRRPRACALLAS